EQVVSLYAGTRGYLDAIPVEDVARFESELLEWVRARNAALMSSIVETGAVDEDGLDAAVSAFAAQFESSAEPEGDEPDAQAQAGAEAGVVDADHTLPETDIQRPEEG
ncbi:MAG: F0F1 ATP synthase subunit alpha, partial [bacterium]|nr:F0F1 ATP synthase subunit alpha [bacterium]